jgi:putative hydrolase of the HAD superfamily
MRPIRAVLFDFGGTLYDYRCLARGESESRQALASLAGLDESSERLALAQVEAMRDVFADYRQREYYLHRDLFRDSLRAMLRSLGAAIDEAHLDHYRDLQWQGHERDFVLREGVTDTLESLRERGLHVGMVSNIDDDQLTHLLRVAGVAPHFDSILSSESARSCKPHAAIFEQALERAGCPPDQALFVGDSRLADVAGANGAGLQSVLLWHRGDRPPPEDEPRARHVISRIPQLLDLIS